MDTAATRSSLAQGNALLNAGQLAQAVQHFHNLLAAEPQNIQLAYRVLAILVRAGCLPEAEALARSLLKADSARADRHIALGRVLSKQRKFSDAIAAYQQALALDPNNTTVTTPLVEALASLGRVEETITELERALVIDPTMATEHSTLVFQMAFSSRYDASALLGAAQHWSAVHAAPLISKRRPFLHDHNAERRLRVGYVSSDFRKHVQRLFTIPLFSHHDHGAYEIVAYSSVKAPDDNTRRIQSLCNEWHDVARLNDSELAQKIRDDRIDVLVDLTQHMTHNRLKVFAEKPAPVQIAWLAYPGTTGVDGMDYRITDPVLDPPGAPLPYSEQSLRLPNSFWCYWPDSEEPIAESPVSRTGHITFGCLNNFMKVNPATLGLWAQVLKANPMSKLLMLAPADYGQHFVRGTMAKSGVASERLEFVDFQTRDQYLRTYNRIDIALDTLPYQGHTTSLDAYWMGVPVVTLIGKTIVGRAGLSFASNLGLHDWVAHDPEQFVQIASRFAADPAQLRQLRQELRPRLTRSPLMDAARFARDMEAAYRTAWRAYCAGKGDKKR